jgi:hypothetical protein
VLLPPKSKNSIRWKPEHTAALQRGFAEHNWNPEEKDGKTIFTIVRSVPEIFEIIRPFLSKNYGGTKENNNILYKHYKTQGSEFITLLAKKGIRRSMYLPSFCFGSQRLLSQFFLHFLFSSENFAKNQRVAGSRKRNLSAGEEEEDNSSNEEISLGSEDTNDGGESDDGDKKSHGNDESSNSDNNSSSDIGNPSRTSNNNFMSRLPKKMPPTSKTAAFASSSGATSAPGASPRASSSKMDQDVELLSHQMDKMKIKDSEKGCNLNCVYPHFWWTFGIDVRFVKYEFLLWSSPPGAAIAKLSKCGKYLYFSNKIPDRFLSVERLFKQYQPGFLGGRPGTCNKTMYQKGNDAVQSIHEAHELNDVAPAIKITLPFPVLQSFEDPYHHEKRGTFLRTYPHENGKEHKVYIFHVTMKDAAAPRKKVEPDFEHVDMDDGVGGGFDEDVDFDDV